MKKLIILSTFLIIGCGARKTQKSETNEKVKTETEIVTKETETKQSETNTNVKETKSTTIDKENNIVKEVTEIVPIDATKESIFTDAKGQKYNLNNSKYRNEKTTDLSKEKSVSLSKYELIQKQLNLVIKQRNEVLKENIELKRQLKNKTTDKQTIFTWQFYVFFSFLLFLIIAMIYIGYKKRKELFL